MDFVIDIEALKAEFQGMEREIDASVRDAAKMLAVQTHAHVVEQASQKLRTRLKMFLDGLQYRETDNVYSIVVPANIRWIEDGMPAHSMLPGLLRSPKAKMSKDGHRYIVVPFNHSKGPSQQTPFANSITQLMKQQLKKKGIPYKGIEKDSSGKPLIGALHRLNLGGPKRDHWSAPALQGLTIYQNKGAKGGVKREAMTFRVASDRHAGTGKWEHPGLEGKGFLDEAFHWAQNEWESRILPELLERFK